MYECNKLAVYSCALHSCPSVCTYHIEYIRIAPVANAAKRRHISASDPAAADDVAALVAVSSAEHHRMGFGKCDCASQPPCNQLACATVRQHCPELKNCINGSPHVLSYFRKRVLVANAI